MTLPPNNQTPPLGDHGFERHYQAGSQEVPGAPADAVVLALARAAATESRLRAFATKAGGGAEARGWSRRWQASLALAACLVLAVGVVSRMQTQLPDVMTMPDSASNNMSGGQPTSPVPQPAAEPSPVVAAAPPSPRPESTRTQPALMPSAEKANDPMRASAPAAEMMSAPGTPFVAAPDPAPAAAPMPLPGASAMARDTAAGSEARVTSRMAARKPDFAEAGITEAQESTLTPQAWLARIVELRSNGRLAEADASLKRFRDRYPAFQVPAAASRQSE